jgi:hypothetical protein
MNYWKRTRKFWIINARLDRIMKCHRINGKLYIVEIAYDLKFNILSNYKGKYKNKSRNFAHKYNYIDIGKSIEGGLIMNDIGSMIFNSKKELDDYILLEKL